MSASPAHAQFYGLQFGGPHGGSYDDTKGYKFGEVVKRIVIRTGRRVDQVQFVTQFRTLTHGGSGGSSKKLDLGSSEYITRYEACWGKKNGHTRVFWLKFITSSGREISGGRTTGACNGYNIPRDLRVFGMIGRSGAEVDRLGLAMNFI